MEKTEFYGNVGRMQGNSLWIGNFCEDGDYVVYFNGNKIKPLAGDYLLDKNGKIRQISSVVRLDAGKAHVTTDEPTLVDLRGPKGDVGSLPGFSATASIAPNSGTPSVSVKTSSEADDVIFDFSFDGLKGEPGKDGEWSAHQIADSDNLDDYLAPLYTGFWYAANANNHIQGKPFGVDSFTLFVQSAGSNSTVQILTSDSNSIFVRTISDGIQREWIEKGARGERGELGPAPSVSATVSVDSGEGTPSAAVARSGTDDAPVFNFEFHNLKGDRGEKGDPGTQSIDIYAVVENTVGVPDVIVEKSGTDSNPAFTFTFKNLKGEEGSRGKQGEPGKDGLSIKFYDGNLAPHGSGSLKAIYTQSLNVGDGVVDSDGQAFNVSAVSGQDFWVDDVIFSLKGPKGDRGPSNGITPHIDESTGNWFLGDVDTGVHAQGPQGEVGPMPDISPLERAIADEKAQREEADEKMQKSLYSLETQTESLEQGLEGLKSGAAQMRADLTSLQTSLDDEVAGRKSEDEGIRSELASVQTAITQAYTSADEALKTGYETADNALTERIDEISSALDEGSASVDGELKRLDEAVAANSSAIAAETERAQKAEETLTTAIQTEQKRAEGAEDALSSKIGEIESAASSNAAAIANEVERATKAENELSSLLSTSSAKIDEAIAMAHSNAAAISAETERATAAEEANASAISAETVRAQKAEKANADAIAAETERAQNVEQTWQGKIAEEVIQRQTGDAANTAAIEAEASARADEDEALSARIDSLDGSFASSLNDEIERAQKAEQANAAAISAETTRAETAEEQISAQVSAEKTRAEKAESTLAASISQESEVRQSADQSLQSAVDSKQDKLVSGTNIKTVDGQSLLGSGNIDTSAASQITQSDLNVVTAEGRYFAGGGNSLANRPTSVDAFGLTVTKVAGGYLAQILISSNQLPGRIFVRIATTITGTGWSAWQEQATTAEVDAETARATAAEEANAAAASAAQSAAEGAQKSADEAKEAAETNAAAIAAESERASAAEAVNAGAAAAAQRTADSNAETLKSVQENLSSLTSETIPGLKGDLESEITARENTDANVTSLSERTGALEGHFSNGVAKRATGDANGNDISSTYATKQEAGEKYTKPEEGIPASDFTQSVRDSLAKADTALQSAPVLSVAGKTGAVTLEKSDVGLGNVNNTADLDKPISTAVQEALNGKQALISFDGEYSTDNKAATVSTVTSAVSKSESGLREEISAESERAKSSENALTEQVSANSTKIDNEITRATSAESANATAAANAQSKADGNANDIKVLKEVVEKLKIVASEATVTLTIKASGTLAKGASSATASGSITDSRLATFSRVKNTSSSNRDPSSTSFTWGSISASIDGTTLTVRQSCQTRVVLQAPQSISCDIVVVLSPVF